MHIPNHVRFTTAYFLGMTAFVASTSFYQYHAWQYLLATVAMLGLAFGMSREMRATRFSDVGRLAFLASFFLFLVGADRCVELYVLTEDVISRDTMLFWLLMVGIPVGVATICVIAVFRDFRRAYIHRYGR